MTRFDDTDWVMHLIRNFLAVNEGWYEISGIDSPYADVMDWVQLNVKGPCKQYGRCWFFKEQTDYTAFVLRWVH